MDTMTYPLETLSHVDDDSPQPNRVWKPYHLGDRAKRLYAEWVPIELAVMFDELLDQWSAHIHRNRLRYRYYDGKNKLKDFGISTPPELLDVEMVVDWPNKAVTALADRVQWDGFIAKDPDVSAILDGVSERSLIDQRSRQFIHSQLIYGCQFATVGVDENGKARIDFHSAETATAVWDEAKGRVLYGMVIDKMRDGQPVICRMFTDDAQIDWSLNTGVWECFETPISMGRVPMDVLTYRPTDRKPFGQSRISRAVMSYTDRAVRCALGGDISYQYSVSPQKYLLGTGTNPWKHRTRWEAYIGNIFAVGYNSNDGVMPQFGQLPQPSMQQYSDYMRQLAAGFAGSTNIPVSQLGIIHDQPASAEAIYAANEPLVIEATDLINGNKQVMRSLARMAVAAEMDVPLNQLSSEQADIMARYLNPAMPSVVSQTDAAIKLVSAVPEFAGTDEFWKLVGMPEDTRREIEVETQRKQQEAIINGLFGE